MSYYPSWRNNGISPREISMNTQSNREKLLNNSSIQPSFNARYSELLEDLLDDPFGLGEPAPNSSTTDYENANEEKSDDESWKSALLEDLLNDSYGEQTYGNISSFPPRKKRNEYRGIH